MWLVILLVILLSIWPGSVENWTTVSNLGRPLVSGITQVVVRITAHGYQPSNLVIDSGTQVIWVNEDDCAHTVTSIYDPIRLQSPALGPGEKYSILFNRPGRHPYRCRRHPFMRGSVVVRGDENINKRW